MMNFIFIDERIFESDRRKFFLTFALKNNQWTDRSVEQMCMRQPATTNKKKNKYNNDPMEWIYSIVTIQIEK